MSDKRRCYFVTDFAKDEEGNYIPCIAEEGTPGYWRTDWNWGSDLAQAEKFASLKNQALGLTDRDAFLIQVSSMRRPA